MCFDGRDTCHGRSGKENGRRREVIQFLVSSPLFFRGCPRDFSVLSRLFLFFLFFLLADTPPSVSAIHRGRPHLSRRCLTPRRAPLGCHSRSSAIGSAAGTIKEPEPRPVIITRPVWGPSDTTESRQRPLFWLLFLLLVVCVPNRLVHHPHCVRMCPLWALLSSRSP